MLQMDDELLADYLTESREHLSTAKARMLAIEVASSSAIAAPHGVVSFCDAQVTRAAIHASRE
jgi:hypothetical protein